MRSSPGKEKVPGGHRRCCPEREEKAQHDGMTHIAIEPGKLEANRSVRSPGSIEVDLSEPEQVEVVNQERGHEHESPASPEDSMQEPATDRD